MLLAENSQKMVNYIISNRQHWRVMFEGNVFRIVTNQQLLSWSIIRDIEEKYDMEVFDVTNTPTSGIVVSFNSLT